MKNSATSRSTPNRILLRIITVSLVDADCTRTPTRGYTQRAVASKRQDEDWFFRIGEELQRLSDEVMRGIVVNSVAANRFWRPNVDVCEAQDEITLTIELAGVSRRDMTIQYVAKNRSLILRGKRRAVELPNCQQSRSHQLEIYYGDFEREIRLPEVGVEPEGIQASFSEGMLIIRIPKRIESHTRRSIPVTEDNG